MKLEDLERVANPSILGQCLHFLVSTSISRTLMLWPFMLRGSIKCQIKTEVTEDKLTVSIYSDNDDTSLLSLNENEITDEEEGRSVLEHDELTVIVDKGNQRHESETGKQNTGSLPILTSSGLLFESEKVLKGISAVTAFHETVETLIDGVWNAFLSSLLVNGLVNYIRYPEERAETNLLDTFGLTGLRNIACVRAIDSIKNSILCSSDYKKGYEDVLSSSLSSHYIWPFIAGLPSHLGS